MSTIVQGSDYRFTLLTERLIRLEYSSSGEFEDRNTQLVANRDFGPVTYSVLKDHNGHAVEIETEFFHLYYDGGPFAASNLHVDAKYQYTLHDSCWYYGEKTSGNLGGTNPTLDLVDGSTPIDDGIMSRDGYAYLDDTDSFAIEDGHFVARAAEESDGYFFAYGRNYREELSDFYRLSGTTPLIPRYALGNWWSRYYRYTQQEYLDLMDQFESEQVPISVSIIDMDWHRTDDVPARFGSTWTGYSWNRTLFPDPQRFLKELKKRHKHISLNTHPAGGIRAFEDAYPAVAKHLGLDIEKEEPAIFDLDDPKFRESYFDDVHHPMEDEGVDFWWLDWQQGTSRSKDKVEPLWNLNHYHFLDSMRRNDGEGLILSRFAGPGSHRYPIGFSGDTVITWASLNFQPYFTATATNIGYTWWSHDIGGHIWGSFDPALSLRWLQLGVFSPINRLHSSENPFSGKEPWKYRRDVREYMDVYLRLRNRLVPYLDSANIGTHDENVALIEPLYYRYPDNEESYLVKNQYFFGSELMVAPITTPQDPTLNVGFVDAWLPEGQWMDIFTDLVYQGDQEDIERPMVSSCSLDGQFKTGETTIRLGRTLENIPVLAKLGAIVPMATDAMQRADVLPEELDVQVYGNKDNEYVMREHLNRSIAATTITVRGGVVSVAVDDPNGIIPEGRQLHFTLHAFTLDGNSEFTLTAGQSFAGTPQSDGQQNARAREQLLQQLQGAEIPYEDKRAVLKKIDDALTSPINLATYAQTIENANLRSMVVEYTSLIAMQR
ncbi:glycoside hydrolase family 31 protein [Bifidobacterium tibiigranuli]|jgi:alpha-glucosidase (family GH31 glycosyl hydrolase)|uniref:glycoside hydrolase family 31 protein n=1 Tax=Bifidobacterium tibiigranuli TaxID=2172043 RepID=UPI0026EB20E7|nr:glycoside hydrolase family 31 protein [Bifidobacterium tibiigranuli]MCI1649053.1 alpha-glucosidase [Bifidobacterium tibiigranuli]MCI2186288.1 alpha-glucosidase [Bifidobacterium tibiigranuli]MCI2203886.1 alpha-glucosidase [Bifidobacterium tibiigranuli]